MAGESGETPREPSRPRPERHHGQSPAPRHQAPGRSDGSSTHHEPARAVTRPTSFAGSIGWAAASAVVPGSGLLRTRFAPAGVVMLVGLALVLGVAGVTAWLKPDALLGVVLQPAVLSVLSGSLVVAGVLWVLAIVTTHLALRPPSPPWWQRLLGSVVVGVLTLAVALPSFWGARTVWDTSSLISGVFTDTEATPPAPRRGGGSTAARVGDPWADIPRLNVLILGGDSGQARAAELGARTDTVILASMNTETGDTVLFSLPRQTQKVPFPEGSPLAERWPDGFRGRGTESDYYLNAMYHNVPRMAPEAIPADVQDPGAEVLKQAVGAALGLDVDYYAMVNMDGFIEFINALGGVTVNINKPIPVGGVTTTNTPPDRWLSPGPDQHLNGVDALWFARGRYGEATGDYARMARQRCLIQALVEQTSPTKVLTNYEALTRAGRNIVETDVPNRLLPALITLANRVRTRPMTSVSFENGKDGFSTSSPDWALVRDRVQTAITPPPPAPTPTASGTQTGEPGETPAPAPTIVDECAYNPEQATP